MTIETKQLQSLVLARPTDQLKPLGLAGEFFLSPPDVPPWRYYNAEKINLLCVCRPTTVP